MGRYRETDASDEAKVPFTPQEVPPARVDGRINPEHFRVRMANATGLNEAWLVTLQKPMPQYDAMLRAIREEAKYAGLDAASLADARTPEERLNEAVAELLTEGRSIFETARDELELLEAAMDKADAGVLAEYERKKSRAEREGTAPLGKKKRAEWEALKKAWKDLIRRAIEIQDRAANAVPGTVARDAAVAARASHLLRYMIYVGRSNMPERLHGPSRGVYDPAEHLCKAALHLYEAEHGIHYSAMGVEINAFHCDGAILVMPPGHGKTDLIRAHAALGACNDPYTQGFMVHAIDGKACENLQYLQMIFDKSKPEGRRNLALFPGLRLSKHHNTQKSMRFDLAVSLKSDTFQAAGIGAKMSGSNASRIYFDDPVDQNAVDSEAERNKTSQRIAGTWLPRLRGNKSFYVMIATLWHEDDAVARRIAMAERGEIPVKVLVMGVGGPTGNAFTAEPFATIWPEEFPPARLRRIYNDMRNPRLYACQYMCVTMSEDARVVRKLRYYDPKSKEHQDFQARAIFHLSADPAATAKASSDSAGIVYAALGEVTVKEDEDQVVAQPRLRILSAYEIKATQTDLAHWMGSHAHSMPVDTMHIETVSAFVAVTEIIRDRFGIECVQHPVRNKDKLTRLKQAAPAIDDFYGMACVEFPGVSREGDDGVSRMEPDDSVRAMAHQILNFGATKRDHMVDALTQLVNHLMPSLRPGREGQATRKVRERVKRDAMQEAKDRFWEQWKRDVAGDQETNETQAFNAMFN